jgi:hypothetical protein
MYTKKEILKKIVLERVKRETIRKMVVDLQGVDLSRFNGKKITKHLVNAINNEGFDFKVSISSQYFWTELLLFKNVNHTYIKETLQITQDRERLFNYDEFKKEIKKELASLDKTIEKLKNEFENIDELIDLYMEIYSKQELFRKKSSYVFKDLVGYDFRYSITKGDE